jgi:ABC-type antimicrobial peptide transport system permease subunit
MKDMESSVGASSEHKPAQGRQHLKLSEYAALWEAFKIAVDSIWSHKMRSILTLLGIIIGVTAVVTVGAAIEGLGEYVSSGLESFMGNNTFTVTRISGRRLSNEQYMELIRKSKAISLEEMEIVKEKCTECAAISPSLSRRDTTKRGGVSFNEATIRGIGDEFSQIQDLELQSGRFLSAFVV